MDHAKEAQELMNMSSDCDSGWAAVYSNHAIAHTLLAIAEEIHVMNVASWAGVEAAKEASIAAEADMTPEISCDPNSDYDGPDDLDDLILAEAYGMPPDLGAQG